MLNVVLIDQTQLWSVRPAVYHQRWSLDRLTYIKRRGHTACGLPRNSDGHVEGASTGSDLISIHIRKAIAIARPCRSCFPTKHR
jgi:hypothetical protein